MFPKVGCWGLDHIISILYYYYSLPMGMPTMGGVRGNEWGWPCLAMGGPCSDWPQVQKPLGPLDVLQDDCRSLSLPHTTRRTRTGCRMVKGIGLDSL